MKPIVAPTDFSPNSLNSVNYAADLACMVGVHLNLLHVYAIPIPASDLPVAVSNAGDKETEVRNKIEQLKDKLVARSGGRLVVNVAVKCGNVLEEIISYCKRYKPYAVVMGAESTTSFERIFLDGKSLEALKLVEWPLIIVPPEAEFKNIRKIGFACDFKEVLETVRLKELSNIVEEFNAELHVLHISEEDPNQLNPGTVKESENLHRMLYTFRPQYHILKGPGIEKKLSDFAEKNNLDLLIVIPKRHNLLDKIFGHRHSERLVLHAHVPVMALHE